MAFEGLTEKLQGALRKLSSKGKLTVLCESVCCHGDDWNAHRLESRDTGHQFAGLAGKRDAHEDVAGPDHAEIAVGGLVRVHEKRSRARGRERGGKFASDVPRLANP